MDTFPLAIASDHAGFHLKKRLIRFVENELQRQIEDVGPKSYAPDDDYPDYAIPLAKKVAEANGRGILICKNGIGVCIAANKVAGVRAGIGYNIDVAQTMIEDDDTNVLCLAAKHLSEDHAIAVVKKWLSSDFSNEPRHIRRLRKVAEIDQ